MIHSPIPSICFTSARKIARCCGIKFGLNWYSRPASKLTLTNNTKAQILCILFSIHNTIPFLMVVLVYNRSTTLTKWAYFNHTSKQYIYIYIISKYGQDMLYFWHSFWFYIIVGALLEYRHPWRDKGPGGNKSSSLALPLPLQDFISYLKCGGSCCIDLPNTTSWCLQWN